MTLPPTPSPTPSRFPRSVSPKDVFGRLTVLRLERTKNGRRHWLCKCACGKLKTVPTHYLTGGKTTSCGCARVDCGRLMALLLHAA